MNADYQAGYEAQKDGAEFDTEKGSDWRMGWLDAWGGMAPEWAPVLTTDR